MQVENGPRLRRRRPSAPGANSGANPDPARALEQLRGLLVGPEQSRLLALEGRPTVSAEGVAGVLPEAVSASSERRGEELSIALEQAVTTAVDNVVRRDAEGFARVLAPSIGTAVRRAVSDALRSMIDRLQALLERALSMSALRWRLEAARTGRPFAEVALLHSLIYRVEQVLLVHLPTGLVLAHVEAEGVAAPDPDQVSAMMTAIDAFAQDAFKAAQRGHLLHVQVGELTCWVEWGPSMVLVSAVRGLAPPSFADLLRTTQERLHLLCRKNLLAFRGDVGPFEAARPIITECLVAEDRPPSMAGAWLAAIAALLVVGGIILVLVQAVSQAARERTRLAGLVTALNRTPGLVVLQAGRDHGHYRFVGLRDPLASQPADILRQHGVKNARLRFQPFLSLHPALALSRARTALRPPPDVSMSLDAGVLRLRGVAQRAFIDRANTLGGALPGVQQLDARGLRPREAVEQLDADARRLEQLEIRFDSGSARIRPEQRPVLARAKELASGAQRAAAQARLPLCIVVRGDADPGGSAALNRTLSQARALTVAAAFRQAGISPARVATRGSAGAPEGGVRQRRVQFQVERSMAPGGRTCARDRT
jgi:OOP family OmpA-OmpF porin